MKHSEINLYESLLQQSLLIPDLVTKSAKKDLSFLPSLDRWLLDTENIMKENNISKCAEIAGLRSRIIAADLQESKLSKRKERFRVATSIIDEAQSTLLSTLEPIEHRIAEARVALRQLLGVAYQAGMIDNSLEFNEMIQKLWSSFSSHEQLRGAVASVLVLVNHSDALRLLAEEIDFSMIR